MPVFLVDKPVGPTSHDVVAAARRSLGTRKVGHAGTLDPLASGLLILLVDEATKLSPFLGGEDKAYLAWIAFGAGTPTLDAEGPVTSEADASHLDASVVRAALPDFLDVVEQRPPAFSAVKKGGEKGYEAARRGRDPDLPPRPAGYHVVELLGFAPDRAALPLAFAPDVDARTWRPDPNGRTFALPPPLGVYPVALVWLAVASGTYIRAFARDLGAALGVPAHLAGLVRTRVGAHDLADAADPAALPGAPSLPMAEALPYPVVRVDAESAARVRLGQRLALELDGRTGLVDPDGELVAVADTEDGRMRLLRVWT